MPSPVTISESPFGQTNGKDISAYTLSNANGVSATVINFGAILQSVCVPNRHGAAEDVVLGFDHLDDYLTNPPYFGATVGRHANRIANGSFTLEGTEYTLPCNNEPAGMPSHLHGGIEGFNKKIWEVQTKQTNTSASVIFTYISPAGEEGYPGTLTCTITYTLNEANELSWKASAVTDAPTVINLVNHTYWNLSGDLTSHIGDHLLQIESDAFLPSNPGLIPLGDPAPIAYTPLDFTDPKPMGRDIDADYLPLTEARGYDQAFILNNGEAIQKAATVTHADSGRSLEIWTDQPAVHFYTGNYIESEPVGKKSEIYSPRCGFCLETENWPDAPNNPKAPSAILRPGETYAHTMICKFSW